eukprot:s1427_g15.t1
MTNAFFQNGVELFHPQRWHMCTPSLKEWAALSLMHNIGSIALEKSGQLAEAAEENDIGAGAAGVGEDDAANWRRMQSRRKARGLAFLQDKLSAFHLLTTLALATLLSSVTNLCFRFVNSDKKGISRRQEERARKRCRRMTAKGSETYVEAADDDLQFDRVRTQTVRCAQLLWREVHGPLHYMVCADCYWPAGESLHSKWDFLAENILRNVAALKWRILTKFDSPPWSLAHLTLPGCSHEEARWPPMCFYGKLHSKSEARVDLGTRGPEPRRELQMQRALDAAGHSWSGTHARESGRQNARQNARENVEAAKAKFLQLEACCLDPFWSRPLQQKVQSGTLDFKRVVADYFASFRPVSLREEQNHVIQRYISHEKSKAVTPCRQRAQTVTLNVKKNYEGRGGRNLNVAKAKVAKAYKKVSKKKADVFQRPRQLGNTMFFYINNRLKEQGGSWQQHKEAWEQLTVEKRGWWQERHKNSVSLKRSQQRMASNWVAPTPPMSTSWNLGDEDWPLQSSLVSKFIGQFQTKGIGVQTLKKIEAESEDVRAYVQAVEAGATKYHFRDAMTLYCNRYMGDCVDQDAVNSDDTIQKIMAVQLPSMGCWATHPGMCATRHRALKPAVTSLFKAVPKKSCVLQFKTGRLVAYVRAVLGQEAENSFCPMFRNQDGPSDLHGDDSEDGESNCNLYEEEDGFISDDLLSDEEKQVQEIVPRGQDGAMDADNRSESAKSGGSTMPGIKTIATDTQILKDCLGSRPV